MGNRFTVVVGSAVVVVVVGAAVVVVVGAAVGSAVVGVGVVGETLGCIVRYLIPAHCWQTYSKRSEQL